MPSLVVDHDPLEGCLRQTPEALLALLERSFGQLAFGDIGDHRQRACVAPLIIFDRIGGNQRPYDSVILAAELCLHLFADASAAALETGLGDGLTLGIHESE